MPVEEIFVKDGVVVGQGFRQTRESGGGNLLESGLVGLVSYATNVQDDAVVGVR